MNIEKTQFEDVLILTPDRHSDERGYFMETFSHEFYNKIIPNFLGTFVQDNESVSNKGVFRGFHWQAWPMQQSKLVRVVSGRIIDIVICLIKDSENYGKYIGVELSAENGRQIFIPRGYAHGFLSLEDNTIVNYKTDNYYSPYHERSLNYGCVNFSIFDGADIDLDSFIVSEKDKNAPAFGELKDDDVFYSRKPNDESKTNQEDTKVNE